MTLAYEELVDFILTGHAPDEVISFKPSPAAQARVSDLMRREKTSGLSPEETSELDTYMHLEHIMRLAKAKARVKQTDGHE
jgi:hypothetical protein